MLILVTYDVNTETEAGRKRLRRVAKTCQNFGQRVQYSVFECQVNVEQYETLERLLLAIIDEEKDNLRFYRLTEPLDRNVKEYGKFRATDFKAPLLI